MKVPSQVGALKESKLVIQQTEEGDFGTYQVDSIPVSLFRFIERQKSNLISGTAANSFPGSLEY